jgi:hypothetical protein
MKTKLCVNAQRAQMSPNDNFMDVVASCVRRYTDFGLQAVVSASFISKAGCWKSACHPWAMI